VHHRHSLSGQQQPTDDHLLDLGRAAADARQLGVAQRPLGGEVPQVAVAAVDLDRLQRVLDDELAAERLGDARLERVLLALLLQPGRL
jgi:uncharacterized protein with von Willebrand factor type A (vWA) domain